jgi:hypothetical protein
MKRLVRGRRRAVARAAVSRSCLTRHSISTMHLMGMAISAFRTAAATVEKAARPERASCSARPRLLPRPLRPGAVVKARTVTDALEQELARLSKRAHLADSTLAATARALAHELDSSRNSATSKSMCAKAMYDAIDRLYDLAPEEAQADDVDEIRRKREERRAAA